jgi:chorismate lyase/3-hydroxybenzoate synthase
MENLRAVCEVGSEGKYRALTDLPEPVYRAYVRHPEDYDALRSMFDEAAGPAARSVWVRGDICREELLLEIELWTRL